MCFIFVHSFKRNCLQVLRFVYTFEVRLDENSALGILMLAHRFELTHLVDECSDLTIIKNLTVDKVLAVFERTHMLESLADYCLHIIRQNTDKLFGSDNDPKAMHLFDLNLVALGKVLELDVLRIDNEVVLFEELLRWARTKCKVGETKTDAEDLRGSVEGRLRMIRLTAMSSDEFCRCMSLAGAKFFTVQEMIGNIQHIAQRAADAETMTFDDISDDLPMYHERRRDYNVEFNRKLEHKS